MSEESLCTEKTPARALREEELHKLNTMDLIAHIVSREAHYTQYVEVARSDQEGLIQEKRKLDRRVRELEEDYNALHASFCGNAVEIDNLRKSLAFAVQLARESASELQGGGDDESCS